MLAVQMILGSLTVGAPQNHSPIDQLIDRSAWVCRTLGFEPDGSEMAVMSESGRQIVFFTVNKGKGSCLLSLDDEHGRVSSFSYSPRFKQGLPPPAKAVETNGKAAQTVLDKLGYAGWLAPGPNSSFVGAVQGHPIFSHFSASRATVLFRGTQLASISVQAKSVKPQGQFRISQNQAVSSAMRAAARRLKRFSEGFTSEAAKGVVISPDGRSPRWVWRVEFTAKGSIRSAQKDTFFVDGTTGQPFVLPGEPRALIEGPGRTLPRWNPPPAPRFRREALQIASKKLSLFAPKSGEPTSCFSAKTTKITTADGAQIALDSERKPYFFRSGGNGRGKDLTDGPKSVALAKKLTASEGIKLPAGRFEWGTDPIDLKPSVRFVQAALGFDYLEPSPLTFRFSASGSLVKFDRVPKLPTPQTKPSRILTKSQIVEAVKARNRSRMTSEAMRQRGEEKVEAVRLGWVVSARQRSAVLAWEVRFSSQKMTGSASKGIRRSISYFRADSGTFLQPHDPQASVAQIYGDVQIFPRW